MRYVIDEVFLKQVPIPSMWKLCHAYYSYDYSFGDSFQDWTHSVRCVNLRPRYYAVWAIDPDFNIMSQTIKSHALRPL